MADDALSRLMAMADETNNTNPLAQLLQPNATEVAEPFLSDKWIAQNYPTTSRVMDALFERGPMGALRAMRPVIGDRWFPAQRYSEWIQQPNNRVRRGFEMLEDRPLKQMQIENREE